MIPGGLDAGTILRLQGTAGNAAVSALLAQRAVESPPPPAPLVTPSPEDSPGFQTVAGRVGQGTQKLKAHPPARSKVAEADRAAAGPTNELRSQGAAEQVDQMARQKPGTFDKAAFVTAVKAAIDKATPKSMEEVDDFSSSGKPGQLKEQVVGEVGKGKDAAAAGIKTASDAAPDTSHASPKPVTPMSPETPGASPADVNAGQAMPVTKPEDQVGLGYTKSATDRQLEEAHVTQDQVDRSNEPEFHDAMAAKQEADQHAETAPQQFRQDEQAKLDQSRSQAGASAQTGLSEMHQVRSSALANVGTHKDKEKGKNEAARAKVSADIEAIYTDTKKDVDETLSGLDTKVGDAFNNGESAARQAFESAYKTKKDAYFEDRYSGILGGARWLKDKLISPPAEVNGFIDEAKQLYQSKMGQVIEQIATIVETELTRATQRIAEGRQKINDYVASQPKELRAAAQQAASDISSRFDELEQAVTDKSSALVDDLAQKYVAAAQAVDERCNAMREENKGLLEKAVDKVKGMIDTILKIKDMLVALAAKAASVVGQILSDPIGFLGNLVGAVKQGFEQFVSNIGKHLEEGLMGWLLGELADAGITMPETFDLKGILNLVLQVLGLTWQNIRARAVGILGEEVVGMIEQGVGTFQQIVHIFEVLREQGLAGLWEMISDKIGDLKAQVIDQIQDFVESKVITAGVTWILSLLNPASAFIKACKGIYDIIMFFVDRGSQIMSLVNTILDNLAAIVSGNISAAANLVESVLAKGLPLAISFLASLLGVGGISEKIKEIIQAVQAPINKAIDWLLKTVVKPVASAAARAVGWVKGKVKAGVDWAKAKGKAGLATVKSKFAKKVSPEDETKHQQIARQRVALGQAEAVLHSSHSHAEAESRLAPLQDRYSVPLKLVVENKNERGELVHVQTMATPSYEMTFADSDIEDPEARQESASMFEEQVVRIVEGSYIPPGRRQSPRTGEELADVRQRPVRLSDLSVQNNYKWVAMYAASSKASPDVVEEAVERARTLIDKAAQSNDEKRIYGYLRAAAVTIQNLYGGRDAYSLDVEHLTEVAQNKGTLPRTQIERKRNTIANRIRTGEIEKGTPEEEIIAMKVSEGEKRQIGHVYAQQVVDDSLGDAGETSTGHGPEEIELLIIGTAVHARITARRTKERASI